MHQNRVRPDRHVVAETGKPAVVGAAVDPGSPRTSGRGRCGSRAGLPSRRSRRRSSAPVARPGASWASGSDLGARQIRPIERITKASGRSGVCARRRANGVQTGMTTCTWGAASALPNDPDPEPTPGAPDVVDVRPRRSASIVLSMGRSCIGSGSRPDCYGSEAGRSRRRLVRRTAAPPGWPPPPGPTGTCGCLTP